MRFSSCRRTFGPTFARSVAWLPASNIIGAIPYVIAVPAILGMLTIPLLAQENSIEKPADAVQLEPSKPPGFGDPQFAFHRIDGGFLRLDLRTGQIASCSQDTAAWICIPGREERALLDHEIARLQRDNAILKNALLEHGIPLPNDMKADLPPAIGAPVETVPRPPQTVPPTPSAPPPAAKSPETDRASRDDAEIERVMGVMEKVWRRLVEMMMNIQRDMQKKG